jgi:hypothetical protein
MRLEIDFYFKMVEWLCCGVLNETHNLTKIKRINNSCNFCNVTNEPNLIDLCVQGILVITNILELLNFEN